MPGNNPLGLKWNLGGKKRRNTLNMDLQGFAELAVQLDGLGGNVNRAVEDALNQAGETIGYDTQDAVAAANLPAQGRYSQGETEEAIVLNPTVEWNGSVAEIGVGFDYGKPGAGGFLITGTPRMRPDYKLEDIYTRKKYMKQLQKDMADVVLDYIKDRTNG